VWEEADISLDNVMVSRDGRTLGALFPWPHAGIANLENKTWAVLGRGCWPSLSPDDANLLWIFDGAHRNLVMHTRDNSRQWTVKINGAPGVDGYEVYHPRWANHVRFFGLSGPYKAGAGGNQIASGGRGVEIYLGRFDRGLHAAEDWVQVTRNDVADFYPDVWLDPAARAPGSAMAGAGESAVARSAPERIVLDARLTDLTVTPSLESIAPYRSALVVFRYAVLNVVTGQLAGASVRVAHWGLRDGKALPSTARRGDRLRLAIEPFDLHPELEGERLILGTIPQDAPLYYDVEPR
jgi:hypothetical protein